MTWMQFVAALVQSLAWPIVVVIAIFAFKRPMVSLLAKIKQLTWGDKTVALYDDKAVEVEARVEVAKVTSEPTKPAPLATSTYVGKIVLIWSAIIDGLNAKIRESVGHFNYRNDAEILRTAYIHGLLTDEQNSALEGLRAMRNLAVHSPDKKIDEKRYTEFFVMADAMATILKLPPLPE